MSNVTPIPKRGARNPVTKFFARLTDFDLLALFDAHHGSHVPRSVLVNLTPPHHALTTVPKYPIPFLSTTKEITQADGTVQTRKVKRGFGQKEAPGEGWVFESNQVLTSKYNVITFLPRNLLEQFRRVANIFFLILVILQFFPRFTTVSPGLSALPLLTVLAITAIKDGYEDMKRHQSDRAINGIKVLTLRGAYHNPNATLPKGRSFGLPSFLSAYFLKSHLKAEADAAEEDRDVERKRGFWGKRKVIRQKKEKKPKGSGTSLKRGETEGEGGLIPEGGPSGATVTPKKEKMAKAADPRVPKKDERMDGDDYEDEEDAHLHGPPPHDDPKLVHAPHLHVPGALHHNHSDGKAKWVKECWEDLKVGDFVRLHGDESVPADLVIVSTSEEENVCYVETKNLDGETNLKSRHAVPELTHLRTSTHLMHDAKFSVQSEAPDVNMFNYSATVTCEDGRLGKDGGKLRCPVTLNTMLLRGTVVRNTDWVIGIVIMTGHDTKIVLNSGGTPSKRSKVERQMNPMVLINLVLLAIMSTMCAVVDSVLQNNNINKGAYWLYGNNRSDDNPNINGLITFANALICFQNIVPISLYISIEFVRLVQAFYIWADDDIMYRNGATKRRTVARSWNLSDDLGQIEYIFSDKTGTLTQNAMLFRQCSIGGKRYIGDDEDTPGVPTTVPGKSMMSASSSDDAATTRVPSTNDGEKSDKKAHVETTATPFHDVQIENDLSQANSRQSQAIYAFFSNLALCHTVLAATEEDGSISYKAQSPDEAALVQAAADVGFVFLGRDKNVLRIQTPTDDHDVEFELLNVIEFSSARKRMSVIVRRLDDEGEGLMLLTKGADNVIFERMKAGDEGLRKATDGHLEDFANDGLRTLCLAYKPLSEEEYDVWERQYHEAETVIEGREDAMEKVANQLEQNLTLLGATAIEDKLQDGVPEAIADLKRAGLKIWVATGDKLETAIAIGKTCNLLSRDMNIIIIKGGEYSQPNSAYSQLKNAMTKFFDAGSLVDQLENQPPGLERVPSRRSGEQQRRPGLNRATTGVSGITDIVGADNGERPGGYGLVIDGASLRHAFGEEYTKDLLLELATRCKAVICCRVSPLQKALIVRLVKDGLGSMCLAIGDGANDVSMIQAADIGVGVAGEEGLQAVNSSDYAIGQFRFLQRLMLVHGHWSYLRNSTMIVNFFYKEIIGVGILFWFQFYCGYSATTVYEYTYLLFWNVIWTLVPVLCIGIFDRNIPDRVLMQVPELYKIGSAGQLFGLYRFAAYMLDGTYQSIVIYFFIVYTYDTTTVRSDGYDITMYEFSTIMAIAAVWAANMYNGFNTRAWNWWVLGGVLIGPVVIVLYSAVYAAFAPSVIFTYVYGMNSFWWPSAYFWLSNVFTIILALIPRYLYCYVKENYFPNDVDVLRWTAKREPNHDWINDPYMPKTVKGGLFEKDSHHPEDDAAPIFSTAERVQSNRPDAFRLGRVGTSQSMTHDMSTGQASSGHGRGYGFDQSDAMLPAPIRRYTSRQSESSSVGQGNRPRKGSLKVGNVQLNPFLRTPGNGGSSTNRPRSSSFRNVLFGSGGNRKSTIHESPDPAARPTSPPRAATRQRSEADLAENERMLGE